MEQVDVNLEHHHLLQVILEQLDQIQVFQQLQALVVVKVVLVDLPHQVMEVMVDQAEVQEQQIVMQELVIHLQFHQLKEQMEL